MALRDFDEGDGTVSVKAYLEQLRLDPSPARLDPSPAGAKIKHRSGRRSNSTGTKNDSRPSSSSAPPLSPRPPGSPPAAGAYRITTLITTTYVKDLHELIQRITPQQDSKRLVASFDVHPKVDAEGNHLPTFWATLMISGAPGLEGEWVDEGPFASKKLAREAVAKKGVEWLREAVKGWGKQGGKMKGGGRGGVIAAVPGAQVQEDVALVDEEEEAGLASGEWMGQLHTYMGKRHFNPPVYTIYSSLTATAFSCTLAIPELTGHSVSTPLPNSNPTSFGSATTFYRKKATARAAAAREAVLWIWSVDPAAKISSKSPYGINPFSPTHSQANGPGEIHIPPELSEASAPQTVAWLCTKLSLCAPEYIFENPAGVAPLVDGWAKVQRVKPGAGVEQIVEIGPVTNIYGKQAAKTKLAELCLYWICLKESKRLGVKVVGLREEFYQEGLGEGGVVEGGAKKNGSGDGSGDAAGEGDSEESEESEEWGEAGRGRGQGQGQRQRQGVWKMRGQGQGVWKMRAKVEEDEESEDDTMSLA